MNVLATLIKFFNKEAISKEDALATLDVVKSRVEADEDGKLTVGELLTISMEVLSTSTAAIPIAFGLFGILVGLCFGVSV